MPLEGAPLPAGIWTVATGDHHLCYLHGPGWTVAGTVCAQGAPFIPEQVRPWGTALLQPYQVALASAVLPLAVPQGLHLLPSTPSFYSFVGCPCQSHGGVFGMRPWTRSLGFLAASLSMPVASLVGTAPERVP